MNNKQVEEIRNAFFKLSVGHIMQAFAYIVLLILMIIVYFNTTETAQNLSSTNFTVTNLEEVGTKLKDTIDLIKYITIASLIILVISTFYLSTINVRIIENVKEESK